MSRRHGNAAGVIFPRAVKSPSIALAISLLALPAARADPWPALAIPPSNRRGLSRPAPRPPAGDLDRRARLLAEALRTGAARDVDAALEFFLPRDPFLAIKDMSGAAGYFDTLVRWYRRDLGRYRTQHPWLARSRFVRFELSRACTWMAVGREANRLPYWSCYRSRLVLAHDGREESLESRVMIHWGDQWFCTHLGPRE